MAEFEEQEVITTLYEGHYHFGVAALVNSLVNSGFKGLLYIGYRGFLPPWVDQLEKKNDNTFHLTPNIVLHFEIQATNLHFGYFKPYFLKQTFEKYSFANNIYYFDPDIVVTASWQFFSNWIKCGICLCLDNCFGFLHHNHPWRKEWINLAATDVLTYHFVDYYVNSGFVGVSRSDTNLLERWICLTEKYIENGGDVSLFEKAGYRAFKGDQDLLNAVITISPDLKFSVIGQEGMGFSDPAYLMTHAVGDIKPWEKNFLKHVIKLGQKPNIFEKNFLKFCSKPIAVFPTMMFHAKKLNMLCASIIGRFYG